MKLTRLNTSEIGQALIGLDIPYGDFNFFKQPPGWNMPEHHHPYFQFLLVTSGDLSITTDQEESILTRNMVSIIPR